MDGLPQGIDLKPLIGATVIEVCFGTHQFTVKLDGGDRIAVEGDCRIISPDRGLSNITGATYAHHASELSQVLGETVVAATRRDDGGISVLFGSGVELQFLNDSREYEAFQLYLGKHIYIA